MNLKLLWLFIFLPLMSLGQQHVLKGFIGVEGGESFTYKLVFTDSAGIIQGYSYTWQEEQKAVKATISGIIDRHAKTLSFKEEKIVSNNGFQSNAVICLIDARLKYRNDEGHISFAGAITSSDVTNVSCAKGSITFPDDEELRKLFTVITVKPADTVKAVTTQKARKPVRIVYDTSSFAETEVVKKEEPNKITAGVEKIYDWSSDIIQLELWDGGHVDGDMISIYVDDEPLITRYSITKEHKTLLVPLSGKQLYVITLVAGNEGNEPPNTTDILLKDGTKEYHLIAYNTIGKKAIIKIRKANSGN